MTQGSPVKKSGKLVASYVPKDRDYLPVMLQKIPLPNLTNSPVRKNHMFRAVSQSLEVDRKQDDVVI
jgi:hypothetical protein